MSKYFKLKLTVLSVLFFLITALIAVPVQAKSAEIGENSSVNNTDFVIKEGVLQKYLGSEKDIIVPEGVTSIAEWAFQGNETMESIHFPEGITAIKSWAFADCKKLESIKLPESLTELGTQTFMNCKTLNEITIPKKVQAMGNYVFQYCSSLESITIKTDCMLDVNMFEETKWLEKRKAESATIVMNGVLLSTSENSNVVKIPSGVTKIGNNAFLNAKITSVTIPSEVSVIGDYAFKGCSKLKSLTLKEGLKVIGDEAFRGCLRLTSITIPESLTKIGRGTFSGCTSLSKINLPDKIGEIGDSAFDSCKSITQIVLPKSLTRINSGLFWNCNKLKEINIPKTVTEIGMNAFYGTPWLKDKKAEGKMIIANSVLISGASCTGNVTIPKGVKYICEEAFKEANITSIIIPEGVKSINSNSFESCKKLSSVKMPDSVTYIGYRAFAECSMLKELNLPKKCKVIDREAFSNCSKLQKVSMKEEVKEIGACAFNNCTQLKSIAFSHSISSIGKLAFCDTAWLKEKQKEEHMIIIGSVLYDASACEGEVTIPKGITQIADYAFNCKNRIDLVTIPDTVISIGTNSFFGCSDLITVNAPENSYAARYAANLGMKLVQGEKVKLVQCDKIQPEDTLIEEPLSGNSVIEDTVNHMTYYKKGIWKNNRNRNTGMVDLIAKNMSSGKETILTQVDSNPIYIEKGFIYYTASEGVYRISTDGKLKEKLAIPSVADQNSSIYNTSIIGISGDDVYYSYWINREDTNSKVIARVGINGKNQENLLDNKKYNLLTTPIMANDKIYYILYTGSGNYSLHSLSLDGKVENIIEKDIAKISELFADQNAVYYLARTDGSADFSIKRIDASGSIMILQKLEPKADFEVQLYSNSGDYLYYTVEDNVYRISTDGSIKELVFESKELGKHPNYFYSIYVKGDWMFIQYDGDENPNPSYCVNLATGYKLYLGDYCYATSFDAATDAIYYRVVTIPGDNGDESLSCRESVYRRLELPLKEYQSNFWTYNN